MKSDAHQMNASASRYVFSSWLRSVGEGWSQFWHEHAGVGHLNGGRNSARTPVVNALHCVPTQPKHLRKFCGSTVQIDQCTVRTNVYVWDTAHLFLLRYGFSSCFRSVSEVWRQFWPVFLPVVGAQIFARDDSTRFQFNSQAPAHWNGAHGSRPLPYQLWLSVDRPSQFGLAAVNGKISGELHIFSISESLNYLQAIYEGQNYLYFENGKLTTVQN